MLQAALAGEAAFSLASADGGLFLEIAAECRTVYKPDTPIWFLCGRDAAERVANWDYGRPEAFTEMLSCFGLLVAKRGGDWTPATEHRRAVQRLEIDGGIEAISATEVRRRIAAGARWQHMVPAPAVGLAARIYG
jgi:nicotinic acid mononucleotide adenylyltransferase